MPRSCIFHRCGWIMRLVQLVIFRTKFLILHLPQYIQGQIQDLVKGVLVVDEMPFIADFFRGVCIWLDVTVQTSASNFSKNKKISTCCHWHYHPSPSLFATTQATLRPFSTIAIRWRLAKITEETYQCLFPRAKFIWRGCFSMQSTPLSPPLI